MSWGAVNEQIEEERDRRVGGGGDFIYPNFNSIQVTAARAPCVLGCGA
jgi:hypothetical protein